MKIASAILIAAFAAGCSSYQLKSPDNFKGESVHVSGSQKELRIGPYELADVQRGWNKASGWSVRSVSSDKVMQQYQFKIARDSIVLSETGCEFRASERSLGLKGGWSFTLGESAELSCQTSSGQEKWNLNVSTKGDEALAGKITGPREYHVQGIGLTGLSKGTRGPVAGFHLFDGDTPLAIVQVVDPRRVMYAKGLDERQKDALVPSIAALMLLDESLRDMD